VETNRGCPFQCTFCDWGSAIAAKVSQFDLERLLKEVDWFADKKIEFIFTCDANYGMLARDYDITKYVADTKQRLGYPKALSVQNTRMARSARTRSRNYCPTPVSTRVLRSLCNRWTQRRSKQSSARIFRRVLPRVAAALHPRPVETYSDLILALPGETYESFANGVSSVVENGQHNRIQLTISPILPNARWAIRVSSDDRR